MHAAIAIDANDGALLGLVDAQFLEHTGGKKDQCGKRPFEEKASYRWLKAAIEASDLLVAGATGVTVVTVVADPASPQLQPAGLGSGLDRAVVATAHGDGLRRRVVDWTVRAFQVRHGGRPL